MKTRLLKIAIALMTLSFTLNSCSNEDDFKLPDKSLQKIVLKNGDVVNDTIITPFELTCGNVDVEEEIFMGTDIDNMESIGILRRIGRDEHYLQPYTKYYWKIVVHDGSNMAETDIFKFYCVPDFAVKVTNEDEGEWAATVTWEGHEQFSDTRITLTPDGDCDYDRTPISVADGATTCHISAGPLDALKYAVCYQWWDTSKKQYFEPVIYDFMVNADCVFDDTVIKAQSTARGIFLDKSKAVADKQFNVYKIGKIGNRVWMLEDLRGVFDIESLPDGEKLNFKLYSNFAPGNGCAKVKSNSGCEGVVYAYKLPLFYKGFSDLIPEGFHVSTDEDWKDLEMYYGVKNWHSSGTIYYNAYGYAPDPEFLVKRLGENVDLSDKRRVYEEDTVSFMGTNVNLLNKLISVDDWKNPFTDEQIVGAGEFNAIPFGFYKEAVKEYIVEDDYSTLNMENSGNVKSGAALYLTPREKNSGTGDDNIVRLLYSGNSGIRRALYWYDYLENKKESIFNRVPTDYVQIRCVKD